MEQIIGEHFSSLESFRSLVLVFDLDPPFINNSIFEIKAFQKEGIYLNGKREGHQTFWWDNDQKALEGNYRNGLREGLWIYWWDNGQKWQEGNYVNGKQEGLWIFWYPNGQKHLEGNYVNGNLVNKTIF